MEGPLVGAPRNIEVLDVEKLTALKRATHPFVAAALKKAVKAVRTATNGTRNQTLNREASGLGGVLPSLQHLARVLTPAALDSLHSQDVGIAPPNSDETTRAA